MASHHRHNAGEGGIDGHHRPVRPLILEMGTEATNDYSHGHDRQHILISLQDHAHLFFLVEDDLGSISVLQSTGYSLCLLPVSGKDQYS
jgi:hypothetical protein